MQYACAGGEFCMVQNSQLIKLKGDKYPIGGWQMKAERNFNYYDMDLEEDTILYLHSDGFKDQFNTSDKKKFGKQRLYSLLDSISRLSFSDQTEMIELVFDLWKGETEQTDDVTLVGLQIS